MSSAEITWIGLKLVGCTLCSGYVDDDDSILIRVGHCDLFSVIEERKWFAHLDSY